MNFKIFFMSLLVSISAFGEATLKECYSGFMRIDVNKNSVSTKENILEALSMIHSRTSEVRIYDTFMSDGRISYVVVSREELKQKKILMEVRENIAQKYTAVPGVEVNTCYFVPEVSITGSN